MADASKSTKSAKPAAKDPSTGQSSVHRSGSLPNVRSSGESTKGTVSNIQVAIRCRPQNVEEKKTNQIAVACDIEGHTVKISHGSSLAKKSTRTLDFDRVFGMYSQQLEVYEAMVKPIVEEAVRGYNCTVFAYGQTGTGMS
jgi:kinesin family protein 11